MSKSAKQKSMDNTLIRVVPIEQSLSPTQLEAFEVQLNHELRLSLNRENSLLVHYNAAFLNFEEVLALLHQLGITARDSRWFRIKAAWYSFVDGNVSSQASARPKACCNKVPKI